MEELRKMLKPSFLEELPATQDEQKVLLCAHGLNQKPSALKPLLQDIQNLGFKVYLMHLPGHAGETTFSHLRSQHYFEAHQSSYQYLKKKYGKPIYFLGYSFGGLIGVHQFDQCPFEKMVLLAPALQMRGYTSLLRFILPYVRRIRSVKMGDSDFEQRYRYHQTGVPSEVYSSFFSVYSSHRLKDEKLAKKAKALVMVHPRDELVSFGKIKRWVHSETHWKFMTLSNKEAEFRRYNHLCFDSSTLGEASYQKMFQEVKSFLI